MNESPLPVMIIYRGNAIVATRVMVARPCLSPHLKQACDFTANIADILAGDYEYEICGDEFFEKGKRFSLNIRD